MQKYNIIHTKPNIFIFIYKMIKLKALLTESKLIYTGLFITKQDRKKILNNITPIYENVLLHHITIGFKPKSFDYTLGDYYDIEIIGVAEDDKAQALMVKNIDILKNKETPHITMSLNGGVKPFYSNELLKTSDIAPLSTPIKLRLQLGGFDGRKVIFH